ncbi:histidine kinase [Duganella dendranthematis]|uniref:Histidine kinase n=1 Tax=Duganella dendranthematis TaxID=2728021 RepID=A0ABX6M873_9BURK|nr:histidine kinase [Duganella dendranthematis]QJD90503.1 histidine kinase [Duganella dendranthematis]
MNTIPSYLRPSFEHDRKLVRRYYWQSLLRLWAGIGILVGLFIVLLVTLLSSLAAHAGMHPGWNWGLVMAILWPALIPSVGVISTVRRYLNELTEAGTPLTAEMFSSRPHRMLLSPLDPLSTYDLCAETLSGLALGMALGYHGPAVFRHSPFIGKVVLGPWRPLWLGRSTEVTVAGEPGQPVEVRIRRRFGINFFCVQRGEALHAVQTISAHLQDQLAQRDRALRAIKREQELERTALQARLTALQAQVEPHFLFNTLANLKYLIRTDADTAQQMLDHLVGYLQNALPDMRSASSTLERELALARNYLSIMQIRMGQRLRFRIDADDAALSRTLPPAMLISLVENAVKHGLERASRPGEIVISATLRGSELRVQVCDDGVGLTEQMGQGFGLANIHERLQLLYGERASLSVAASEQGGVRATLIIKE